MRLRYLIVLATLLLASVLPASALAGGWVVVTLDALPAAPRAGEELVIGFMARQHGQTPLGREHPQLEFTHRASGQRLSVTAIEDATAGHYTGRVTLPQAGAWDWQVELWQTHPMPVLEVEPSAATAAPSASVAGRAWLPLAGAAGLTLLAAICLALSWRLRPGAQLYPEQRRA